MSVDNMNFIITMLHEKKTGLIMIHLKRHFMLRHACWRPCPQGPLTEYIRVWKMLSKITIQTA